MFSFRLHPVESIVPWGPPEEPSLSWFALSLGDFWMPLGDTELFRYSPEIIKHWGLPGPYPDYQIAAFAREVVDAAAAGLEPLPPELEFVVDDWPRFSEFHDRAMPAFSRDCDDETFCAFQWLSERLPHTGFLVANPLVFFLRVRDRVITLYDNRECIVDGIPIWREQFGRFEMPAAEFRSEVESFLGSLLAQMQERLDAIEQGLVHPQCAVSLPNLRVEHETWTAEYSNGLDGRRHDFTWEQSICALRAVAERFSYPMD